MDPAAAVDPDIAGAADHNGAVPAEVAEAEDTDSDQLAADSLDATLLALQRQAADVTGQVQRLASSCQQRQQQYTALTLQYAALLSSAVELYTDDVDALCDTSQQLMDGCEAIDRELQDSRRVETLVSNVRRQVLDMEAFVESVVLTGKTR